MRFQIVLSLLLAFTAAITPHQANASSPAETITDFHNTLLSVLSNNAGETDQVRFEALSAPLDKAFDYQVMIKTIAGRGWRQANAEEQAELQQAFRDVSVATYADQYSGLTDGKFETLGTRDGPRGLKFIDTKLTTPERDVLLTYVMRDEGTSWQIIDVLLDGGKISELARKASEYAKTLRDGGAPALTKVLRDQKTKLLQD